MSINVVSWEANEGFIATNGERKLYNVGQVGFVCRDGSGNSESAQKYEAKFGTIWLSNMRLVYVNAQSNEPFKTFSVPILNICDVHINQPWFGANSLEFMVNPVRNGSLHGQSEVRLSFKEGGVFEFFRLYCELRDRLYENSGDARSVQHLESLPIYSADDGQNSNLPRDPPPSYTQSTQ